MIESIDLMWDEEEFTTPIELVNPKKAGKTTKKEPPKKPQAVPVLADPAPKSKPKKQLKKAVKEEQTLNPSSTYLLLPDGTYYEIERKDAIRLTNEELILFCCKRWGMAVGSKVQVYRGKVS